MRHAASLILILALSAPFTVDRADAAGAAASPGNGLRILGPAPGNATTPVVNELGKLKLRVVDANGQDVSVTRWTTDSPSIAKVTKKGVLKGRVFGFALVTASTGRGDVSAFVAVARVTPRQGAMAQGDTKADTGGNVYLSSPSRHVIYQATAVSASVLAGSTGNSGFADGVGDQARFNVPTGLAVDNRADGGVYVADSMNSCIRKISPSGRVTVVLGTPQVEGTMFGDATPVSEAVMRGPSGVASVGRDFYFADTENHAIYYANFQKGEVRLLCGSPDEPGLTDGAFRTARFNRPTGLAISASGRVLAVADTGNNVIRLVGLTEDADGNVRGDVSTLGVGSSARGVEMSKAWRGDDPGDAIAFTGPKSVSFDATENVYVVDETGASVVTRPNGQLPEKVDLAQPGTLGDPASVTVKGTQAFVLNEAAQAEADAIRVAEVGAPVIDQVTPALGPLAGSEDDVVIDGQNFSKEAVVTLGDREITDFVVESARRIRILRTPAQDAPGNRTLTVLTRGGAAQTVFTFRGLPISEIAAGEITTVAGGVPYIGDGGGAKVARLAGPTSVAVDGAGNLYIADPGSSRIRRVDGSGRITTVAGTGVPGYDGDDRLATSARINGPVGVAVDDAGNLYFADTGNSRIRRVSTAGQISTVAGTGISGYDGDDKPATSASLSFPDSVAVDAAGNVFIVDTGNNRIRRVDTTGRISTVAGTGVLGYDGDNKPATSARLRLPSGVAFDDAGGFYIADSFNHRIRHVDASGIITTVAGTGVQGYDGDNKPAVVASLNAPQELASDRAGNLYIADFLNHRIRRLDSTGQITTVAGTGEPGFDGDDKPASSARLALPNGVTLDRTGNVYVADSSNGRIRRVDATGSIATVAGTGSLTNYDGDEKPAIAAGVSFPFAVAIDAEGTLYIADSGDHRIRRVDVSGQITTVAGTGEKGYDGDDKPATSASLSLPQGIAVDGDGNLYISDTANSRIRRVDTTGRITTVAGTGTLGYDGDDKPATSARIAGPQGIAVDRSGNLYVADRNNHRIRRVDAAGLITTVAGTGVSGYDGDNKPATSARLSSPQDVAVDGEGNLYIADALNDRIRRVDPIGNITTVAGTGVPGFNGDGGPATDARLRVPLGIALDGTGGLYIADSGNNRIRHVDAAGQITTVAGTGSRGYDGDGEPAMSASFNSPQGMAVDGSGNLVIADTSNSAVRVVRLAEASSNAAEARNDLESGVKRRIEFPSLRRVREESNAGSHTALQCASQRRHVRAPSPPAFPRSSPSRARGRSAAWPSGSPPASPRRCSARTSAGSGRKAGTSSTGSAP